MIGPGPVLRPGKERAEFIHACASAWRDKKACQGKQIVKRGVAVRVVAWIENLHDLVEAHDHVNGCVWMRHRAQRPHLIEVQTAIEEQRTLGMIALAFLRERDK